MQRFTQFENAVQIVWRSVQRESLLYLAELRARLVKLGGVAWENDGDPLSSGGDCALSSTDIPVIRSIPEPTDFSAPAAARFGPLPAEHGVAVRLLVRGGSGRRRCRGAQHGELGRPAHTTAANCSTRKRRLTADLDLVGRVAGPGWEGGSCYCRVFDKPS